MDEAQAIHIESTKSSTTIGVECLQSIFWVYIERVEKKKIIKIIYMYEYIIIYLYTSKEKVRQGQKKVFSGPHSDMTLFKIV